MKTWPTQEMLQSIFEYDSTEPLALRWRTKKPKSRAKIGDIAGHWHPIRAGNPVLRRFVHVAGISNRFPAHHAVWIYINGTAHNGYLGFRDGNPGDIRIENLGENMRRPSLETLRENRARYHAGWRQSMTQEAWSAHMRKHNLKKSFGITPEEYERMHAAQYGLCAICGLPETMVRHGKLSVLAVDHCHDSKQVRALLCGSCNSGLGWFKDDPERMRRAADYVEEHQLILASSP